MKDARRLNLVFALVISTLAFLGACAYGELAARRAVERQAREDFIYWKSKLLPIYEDSGLKYNPDPQTKDELFGPLIMMGTAVK